MEQTYYQYQPVRKFTLSTAWTIVGLFLAATMLVALPAGMIGYFAEKFTDYGEQIKGWAMVFSNLIAFILLFVAVAKLYGKPFKLTPLVQLKRIKWLAYPILLILTPALSIVLEPISTLLQTVVPMPEWVQKIFADAFSLSVATFIAAVVIAPICEEIFLRGIVLRGMLSSVSPTKAILWSAFLFAFIHLNPWQGIPAFIIGLLLGWVYWKTRSLLPCIFIHFTNNLLAFIGIYYAEKKGLSADTSFQELVGPQFTTIYIVAFAAMLVSGTLLYLLYGKKELSS